MLAIRLATLTAVLTLSACGTAASSGASQGGGSSQAAETRPGGWDMLDASVEPTSTAVFVAPSWCDSGGSCISRD